MRTKQLSQSDLLDSSDEDEEKFWDEEIKHALEGDSRKRKFTLFEEKVKIIPEESEDEEACDCDCSSQKKRKRKSRKRRKLAPFIKFYLVVYKELSGQCPIGQIAKEAARRWRGMTCEEKAKYMR